MSKFSFFSPKTAAPSKHESAAKVVENGAAKLEKDARALRAELNYKLGQLETVQNLLDRAKRSSDRAEHAKLVLTATEIYKAAR